MKMKFLFKLEKNATETCHLLSEAYDNECLLHAQIFQLYMRFKMSNNMLKMMFTRYTIPHQQRTKVLIFKGLCTFIVFLKFKPLINITSCRFLINPVKKYEKKVPWIERKIYNCEKTIIVKDICDNYRKIVKSIIMKEQYNT